MPTVETTTGYVLHNWGLPHLKEFQSCCRNKITIYPVKYRRKKWDESLDFKEENTHLGLGLGLERSSQVSAELWVVDRIQVKYGEGGVENAFRFQEYRKTRRPDAELCGVFLVRMEALPSEQQKPLTPQDLRTSRDSSHQLVERYSNSLVRQN